MELGNMIFGNSRGIYGVPRGDFEDAFYEFIDKIHCDEYGFYCKDDQYKNSRGGITTKIFEINPYYWGNDEYEASRHNFIYSPTNYELDWYKYPLRDAYSNQNLLYEEFKTMLDNCEEYYHEL